MTVEFPDSFKDADFFDCGDPEDLDHEDPETALERWFDGWCDPNCDVVAIIREQCPVTLTAYKRKTIDDGFADELRKKFDAFIDNLNDDFMDRYDNPNGESNAPASSITHAIRESLVELYGGRFVWMCEPCGSIELDADQCIEILKDWIAE